MRAAARGGSCTEKEEETAAAEEEEEEEKEKEEEKEEEEEGQARQRVNAGARAPTRRRHVCRSRVQSVPRASSQGLGGWGGQGGREEWGR